MKEWIGYYENILTNELSENIALNSKSWKQLEEAFIYIIEAVHEKQLREKLVTQ